MSKYLMVAASVFVIMIIASIYHVMVNISHNITPEELTYTAIGETFFRIDLYMKENNSLPASLNILPKRIGYMNRTVDGWGNELIYSISENGTLTLMSYGADSVPGGQREQADIIKSYMTKDNQGKSIIKDPMWIVNAEIERKKEIKDIHK